MSKERHTRSNTRRVKYLILAASIMVVTLCAVTLYGRYRRTEDIRLAFRAYGGRVYFAFDGPSWFNSVIGPELLANFGDPYSVRFHERITDAELKQLVDGGLFSTVIAIDLDHTAVTDGGLNHLKSVHKLKQLSLYGTAVTDQGIESLISLRQLRFVDLKHTQVTPDGLKRFEKYHSDCDVRW